MDGESDLRMQLPPGLEGKALLDALGGGAETDALFSQLIRDDRLLRLLTLSKFDLFLMDDDHQLPYFHAIWERTPKSPINLVSLVGEGTFGMERVPAAFRLDGGNDNKFSPLVEGVAFALLAAARADSEVRAFLTGKDFTFERWRELVRRRGGFASLAKEIGAKLEEDGALDEHFQEEMEKQVLEFVTYMSQCMDELMEWTRDALPDLLAQMHISSRAWQDRILRVAGLTWDEYEGSLDTLVLLRLVETKSAVAWCDDCNKDRQHHMFLQGTLGPHHYRKLRCPVCNRRLSYAAILAPKGSLRTALLAKDGLLAAFAAWQLKRTHNLEKAFFNEGGRENDFLTTKGSLVEVKMFQTSKDDRTLRRSLESAINDLRKHAPALLSAMPNIERFVLLTNLSKSIAKQYNEVKKPSVAGKEFLVLTPYDVAEDA